MKLSVQFKQGLRIMGGLLNIAAYVIANLAMIAVLLNKMGAPFSFQLSSPLIAGVTILALGKVMLDVLRLKF